MEWCFSYYLNILKLLLLPEYLVCNDLMLSSAFILKQAIICESGARIMPTKRIIFNVFVLVVLVLINCIPLTVLGMSHPVLNIQLTTPSEPFSKYYFTKENTLEYSIPVWYSLSVEIREEAVKTNSGLIIVYIFVHQRRP